MKIYNFLIPLLIFSFGIINCGRDLFGTELERYPGDLADTRFNNIILEHDYQWLMGEQSSLWDPTFFHPAKNMLAGSDNHLGTFLIYVPFRLLGLDEIRSFQCWVFCLFVLNFFVFYKVARKLGLNTAASSAGAFLFTFSMPVLSSIHHIQTLCKFSFPLVIYFFYKILFDKQKIYILYFSLSLIHLFYASIYYGMFTVLILIILFVVALFFKPKLRIIFSKTNLFWIIGSVLLILLSLMPMLQHYLDIQAFAHKFTYNIIEQSVPHPYTYLMPHAGTYFYTFMFNATVKHTNIYWDHMFFIGLISMILIFTSVYYLRKQRKDNPINLFFVIIGITLLIVIIITSAAGKYSFYRYIMEIKSFSHLKVMNRIILLELFFSGMLVAWAINRIELNTKKNILIATLLVIGVCTEHFMNVNTLKFDTVYNAQHNHDYVNNSIDSCKQKPKAFIILRDTSTLPENYNQSFAQLDGMMSSLQKKIPTINGYATVFDSIHFNIHSNTLKGVNFWLYHKGVDTLKSDKEILIIRNRGHIKPD